MENNLFSQEDRLTNITAIEIEGLVRDTMQSVAQWTKISAISGFVGIGISIITLGITYNQLSSFGSSMLTSYLLTQFATIVVSFFINLFLFNFSRNLSRSLDDDDQESFVKASLYLKNYFRMIIIMVIVSVILGLISGGSAASAIFRLL
jgi:hypothetical protein